MRRGKVRADSASTPDDKSTGSPVFVDDSGRRLFRTRAAAWSGTTTAVFFLGSIGVAVLTGSLGGPSDWSRPFAPPSASSPSPASSPTPGSPGTAEAVIILPQHPTTGPPTTVPPAPAPSLPTTAPTPTSAPPTTVPTTPSPTASATVAAGKATHKPTAPPGKPTAKATGKPTAPPGKP
ncbi:MAG TPA: hypothetical protein VGK17_08745 [Propionicimonas sp.]